jgi:hypothetical protein
VSGSLDDQQVEIVNVGQETVLAILVYPDGKVRFNTRESIEWVAETLQTLADSVRAKIAHSEVNE